MQKLDCVVELGSALSETVTCAETQARQAAGDDTAGWDMAAASAEIRPEAPLSGLVAGEPAVDQGSDALVLIAGTLPGVIAGSVIRVELLPSARLFGFVVAAVLLPLGAWLALTRPARAGGEARPARVIPLPVLILLAVVVGCVGGIYGIGGGSILAPILIGTGRPAKEVAPAARLRARHPGVT